MSALDAAIAPAALATTQTEFPKTSTEAGTSTKRIEVDFSRVIGAIRPLNGVNGGPLATFDLTSHFSDMAIRHVRLHDVPFMYSYHDVVDIEYVFPRSDANANDPNSYDFSLTDHYIQSIRSLGAEITYRLGYNAGSRRFPHRNNAPPQDCVTWAAICSHIVQHYNQGWADGYHYNIKYWEVWNEPDVPIFWSGTPEEYYKLYEVTARALRSLDPGIKVGGPALGDKRAFLDGFLKYCAVRNIPLDFVSWHIYAKDPREVSAEATAVRKALDQYGFSKTESVMDEWNYFLGDWTREENDADYRKYLFETQMGGPPGAGFAASVLIGLQDSDVSIADFYQGTTRYWGGLFDEFGVPRKPCFVFKAFKFLLDTPERVFTSGSDDKGFAVIAGLSKEKSEASVLISDLGTQGSRYEIEFQNLPWKGTFIYKKYMVDSYHDLDLVMTEKLKAGTLTISDEVETPSVSLIRLHAVT